MAIHSNGEFGQRMIKVLGLPEHTVWFELRCAVNEVVTVKCAYLPDIDAGDIEAVVAEYEIVQRGVV